VTKTRVESDVSKQLQVTLGKREAERQGTEDALAYLEELRRTADVRKNPKAFE
jgi:hypothetical protein